MIPRKKQATSRTNLVISAVFHSAVIAALFFFAAREGMLGKKLKEITVTMAPKEKKPEPPKPKPEEPKVEPPKPDEPKPATVPPPPRIQNAAAAPPPSVTAPPAAAPPVASLPAFSFSDGAKDVQVTTDSRQIYKGLVEHALRSRWKRPEDIVDDTFVVDVEIEIGPTGNLADWRWVSGSGDQRWDESVKQAIAQTKVFSRPPPKGFPGKVLVRFDVEVAESDSAIQLQSR